MDPQTIGSIEIFTFSNIISILSLVILVLTVSVYALQLKSLNRQVIELQKAKVSTIHNDLARQAEVTNEFFWKEKVRYAVLSDVKQVKTISDDTSKEIIALHFQIHLLQTAFRGLSKDEPANWAAYERWFRKIVFPWIHDNPELVPFFDAIVDGRELFSNDFITWLGTVKPEVAYLEQSGVN
jgi:hypothetical protein